MKRSTYVIPIIICIIALLGGVIGGFFVKINQHPVVSGSSSLPVLDLVSGDIPSPNKADIASYLSNLTGKDITVSDIAIHNYKKTYNDNYAVSYTVTFTADITATKSSYDVTYQVVNDRPVGITASCAAKQTQGYRCDMPQIGGL